MGLIPSSTGDSEDNFLEEILVLDPTAGKLAPGNSSASLMPGRSSIAPTALGPCCIPLQPEPEKLVDLPARLERYAENVVAARPDQSTFLPRIFVFSISIGGKWYRVETILHPLCLANPHRGGAAIESQEPLGIPVRGVSREIRNALTNVIFGLGSLVGPHAVAERPPEKAPISPGSYAPPILHDSRNEENLGLRPDMPSGGACIRRLPVGLSAISGPDQSAGSGLDVSEVVADILAVVVLVQAGKAQARASSESHS